MESNRSVRSNPAFINDLSELRTFVHATLCDHNQLEINAFQMTERILVRGGNPCGILFCLHGPRSVRLLAVWDTDTNSILFYGSTGERQHKCRLLNAPKIVPQGSL